MLRLRGDLIRASDNLIFAQLTNRGNERLFMKTKTSLTRNSISWSPLRHGLILNALALAFACFALAPQARAVCQDGCLDNQNTALGESVLINATGAENTAIGWVALESNTTGIANTAVGWGALTANVTGSLNTAVGDGALEQTTAGGNTAVGADALFGNTTGSSNTATGVAAPCVSTRAWAAAAEPAP